MTVISNRPSSRTLSLRWSILALGLPLLTQPALGQSAEQITLKYDDGYGVSGKLLSFDGQMFQVEASVGRVSVPADEVYCIGTACPEGTTREIPPNPIELVSHDGALRITGNLVSVEDDTYVVMTSGGEFQINVRDVTCTGAGCVDVEGPEDQQVSLVRDGLTIEGKFVRLDGDFFIITHDTMGELRVDAATFTCQGAACP